jgi:hypothetical protein
MAQCTYREFIGDLLNDIKQIIEENQDWVYIIGGSEGAGKSLFAFMTINEIKERAKEYLDKVFYINDDLDYIKKIKETAEYIYEHYLSKGKIYDKFNIFWYDEAAASLYNRMHSTYTNRYTNLTLIQCRVVNGLHFFLQPCLFTIDPYVREWRNNVYIHIVAKNKKRYAYVFYRSNIIENIIFRSKKFECAIKTNDIYVLEQISTYWFEIPQITDQKAILEYQKNKMVAFLQRINKYYEKMREKEDESSE